MRAAVAAFTMAEILLSLTIIGVVATITLPSLTGNINERTWHTQRKALFARFSQALALMPALNGYGTLVEVEVPGVSTFGLSLGGGSQTPEKEIIDTAAETFVTAGLSKVMKLNNICDNEHLSDCGLPDKITPLDNGTETIDYIPKTLSELNPGIILDAAQEMLGDNYFAPVKIIDSKAAAFETQNGESIAVYYNPHCIAYTPIKTDSEWIYQEAGPLMCANFIYDLNGTKGPNTVGKDIGYITAFYSYDPSVVAPMPSTEYNNEVLSFEEATSYCHGLGEQYRIPNKDETSAIFINRRLSLPEDDTYHRWTSTLSTSNSITDTWIQHFSTGIRGPRTTVGQGNARIRCIFR